ncbi:hypothetical protein ACQ4PT_033403 [Festuca glaucescens]
MDGPNSSDYGPAEHQKMVAGNSTLQTPGMLDLLVMCHASASLLVPCDGELLDTGIEWIFDSSGLLTFSDALVRCKVYSNSIAKSTADWKHGTNVLQIFSKLEIFINQKDLYGNLVPEIHPFDAAVLEKASNLSVPVGDLQIEAVAEGIQQLSFNVGEPGEFVLTILDLQLKQKLSSIAYVYNVFVGYSDGSNSFANGPGIAQSVVGSVSSFMVFLEDQYRDPSPVETAMLQVQILSKNGTSVVNPIISPVREPNETISMDGPNSSDYGPAEHQKMVAGNSTLQTPGMLDLLVMCHASASLLVPCDGELLDTGIEWIFDSSGLLTFSDALVRCKVYSNSIAKSTADWKHGTNVLQIFSKLEIFINQKDLYGNLVPEIHPFDAAVLEKASNLSVPVGDLQIEAVAEGIQQLSFNVGEPGEFVLTILDLQLKQKLSSIAYVYNVFVGYSDGSNSFANGPGIAQSVVGSVSSFMVFLEDQYRDPSPVETAMLQVQILSKNGTSVVNPIISPVREPNETISMDGPNSSDYGPAEHQKMVAGNSTLQTPGMLDLLVMCHASASLLVPCDGELLDTGPIDIAKSTADWKHGTNVLQIFSKLEIFINQKDLYGNLVPEIHPFDAAVLEKASNLSVLVGDLQIEAVAEGIQQLSFNVGEPGEFVLTILDLQLKQKLSSIAYVYNVFVGYSDGSNSFANGSGIAQSVVGSVSSFMVFLEDQYRDPSPVETAMLQVQILSKNGTSVVNPIISPVREPNETISMDGPNSSDYGPAEHQKMVAGNSTLQASHFNVSYTPEIAGEYDIWVLCGNIVLNNGNPYAMTVSPGAVSTFISSDPLFEPRVKRSVRNEVTVRLRDSFLNPVVSLEPKLRLQLTSANIPTLVNTSSFAAEEFVNNKDGSYTTHYVARYLPADDYFSEVQNDNISVWEDESASFDVLSNDYIAGGQAEGVNLSSGAIHETRLFITVNDLGNYGCYPDYSEMVSTPLSTAKTVRLVKTKPMNSRRAILVGSAIAIEILAMLCLGGVLLYFLVKCMSQLKGKQRDPVNNEVRNAEQTPSRQVRGVTGYRLRAYDESFSLVLSATREERGSLSSGNHFTMFLGVLDGHVFRALPDRLSIPFFLCPPSPTSAFPPQIVTEVASPDPAGCSAE